MVGFPSLLSLQCPLKWKRALIPAEAFPEGAKGTEDIHPDRPESFRLPNGQEKPSGGLESRRKAISWRWRVNLL